MGIFKKLTDIVGGSLFKEIKEGVMAYFPPDMTPQQKAEAKLKLEEFLHRKHMETSGLLQEAANQLDKRISDQEGTAKDLKSIPIVGHIIIFLRGCQRPAWGFLVMYLDFMWLTSGSPEYTDQQGVALICINLLVLSFLFGERTVKNIEPFLIRFFTLFFGKNNSKN